MSRGTLTVKRGKKQLEIPLTTPPPRWRGDDLLIQTPTGKERVRRDEVVGWQWDKNTHIPT